MAWHIESGVAEVTASAAGLRHQWLINGMPRAETRKRPVHRRDARAARILGRHFGQRCGIRRGGETGRELMAKTGGANGSAIIIFCEMSSAQYHHHLRHGKGGALRARRRAAALRW